MQGGIGGDGMTEPLSDKELHELADELAYINAESLSLDPIRATRAERLLSNEVPRLLASHADLLEALLDVVNQAYQVQYVVEERKCIVRPHGSAEGDSVAVLERLGYARPLSGGRFELVWPERPERKG